MKVTTAIVAPDAAPAAPAAPAPTIVQPKPQTISMTGPTWSIFGKLTALVRMGYMPMTIENYPATVSTHIVLVLGNPDAAATAAAEAEVDDAAALAEIQRIRDIQTAADQLLKDRERAAAKAEMAVKVAEAEAHLKALKAAAEATA
jgi:hypothetical protein